MGYLFCFLNRLNAFFIYNFISVASKTVTKKLKESSYINQLVYYWTCSVKPACVGYKIL